MAVNPVELKFLIYLQLISLEIQGFVIINA